MNRETLEQMYPELCLMFATYFHQHYTTFEDKFDENKPIIPQLTYAYKKLCNKEDIDAMVKELKSLIHMRYTEEMLDKITYGLGMWIDVNHYGYTHEQFLLKVLNLLRDKNYQPID